MATYSTNKPAVRDSFDDDDVSDDVDDEVFIRDGKNGFKKDEERGVKRPLMAPRRKAKPANGSQFHPEICKQPQCSAFCVPCCYGLLALVALFGLVSLVVIIVNMFPFPLNRIRIWSEDVAPFEKLELPCLDLKTQNVWAKTFPKLTSEAALKLNDVNKDGVSDIIIGYGTGADELGLGEEVCATYMPGVVPCQGGVMALDGRSGSVLWQHWTHRSVLFVDCSSDITGDQTNDCIVSGKGGVLSALNGLDGNVIWKLKKPPNTEEVDVYAVQFISDIDFDLVPDILTAHSSIHAGETQGHLLVLSGRTSSVVAQVVSPHYQSVFNPPQLLVRPDGTSLLLFSTGSGDSPGGLYVVPLHSLVIGNITESIELMQGGSNDAPILVDLNKDGTEDIVAVSGEQVVAIDGVTFIQLWNYTTTSVFGRLQLLNSPTPAYFNDDDVPDLLFSQTVGNSYPEYYFSQTVVVDGRTGQPILDQAITSSSFVDVPGIALSMSGSGNDFFLYWVGVCTGHEEIQQRFSFLNSTPIRQRAKADLCQLRFNTTLDIRLYAFSQHTPPPGILLYSSELHGKLEQINSTVAAPSDSRPSGPLEKNKWPKPQQSQHPPLSNFHHTGDSVEHLKSGPHHSHHHQQFGTQELPVNVEELERIAQRHPHREWHPQEAAYGDLAPQSASYPNTGMYGNIFNDLQIPELEVAYGQGAEDGPLFPPSTLGRDERADSLDRSRRSVSNRALPHVGTSGVLVPSLDDTSVGVVVTTDWLPAAQGVYIRLPRDQQCIQERMAAFTPEKYEDLEALRARVEDECLLARGVAQLSSAAVAGAAGQLTVTRLALTCDCDLVDPPREECTHMLPLTHQSWPQRGPNTYYKPHTFSHSIFA